MSMLNEANSYIEQNKKNLEERPVFHVAPPIGWMNDPNGFSQYKGKVHLFYQFYPYDTKWGPMHWGHVVSEDFVKWRDMPVSLAPEDEFDREGCFSGSAIELGEEHVLLYTGVIPGENGNLQNQCLAIGNGKHYTKWKNNPVISGDVLPDDCSRIDFRDPKLWKEDDGFYMIAGNKKTDGTPQLVCFYSADLRSWEYRGITIVDKMSLRGISGRVLDMTVEISGKDFNEFGISIACDEKHHTDIIFYRYKNMLELDRTYSGMTVDTIGIRRAVLRNKTDSLKMRMIMDRYSVELFVGEGEQALSMTYYTPLSAENIIFSCDKSAVLDVTKYDITV